jgi:hypothetical protein
VKRSARIVIAASLIALAVVGCGQTERPRPKVIARAPLHSTPARRMTDCVHTPSACGYPDPTNTGVPPGTSLTPSGPITVSTPGAVISRLDVTGTITVTANHVTIEESRVTAADASGSVVFIAAGVSGTLIRDSVIRGENSGPGSVADGVLNAGTGDTRAERVYVYNCAGTDWNGPGTVTDSYLITNAYRAGAHTEPIYYGGGTSSSLTVEHNTLLNPFNQTAAVFAGNDYGPQENLTIDDNLLAGGGYVIYGGANSSSTANVRVTNNRFSSFYYPHGGYFGLSAYMKWPVTTWRGNYWDAGLAPASG